VLGDWPRSGLVKTGKANRTAVDWCDRKEHRYGFKKSF